ncbi:MAG: hypothetical protein ACTIOA_07930 [Brachybacterium tyrofermentans]
MRKRSQGPSKAEVRRRAKRSADDLLASGGARGTWKGTSPIADYITRVSAPAIESAGLRESSRSRYAIALKQLTGGCENHRHKTSLAGHSIASATRFRALESCLLEIADLHGSESAHQARTVLSKYVLQQLIRDELITGNPLSGMRIDLSSAPKTTGGKKGGVALSRQEYALVLDYLLALDPADGVKAPKQGRWKLEDKIAKRRNAIDLTLLQAATGLRVSEANQVIFDDIEVDDGGAMHVSVSEEVAKTGKSRRVPVLDDRVVDRVLTRRNVTSDSSSYVIGAPTDDKKVWERDNSQKATTTLYVEMANELGIAAFKTERTHIWRATLNSLLLDAVPEVVRAAFFGHDAAVNRSSYTDLTDTSVMVTAARRLRVV